jgi:hypothetical protein
MSLASGAEAAAPRCYLSGTELGDFLATVLLDGKGKIVAMIRAAVDESGTHDLDAVLSVAMCAATSTQWRKFSATWEPERPADYHAKKETTETNLRLAKLMQKHLTFTRVITIRDREYRAYAPQPFRSQYGSAYAAALQYGILWNYQWVQKHGSGKIAYVLESGHKSEAFMQRVLGRIVGNPWLRDKYKVLSQTWVGKGDTCITDTADLLSYSYSNWNDGDPVLVLLRSFAEHLHTDEEAIRGLVEQVTSAQREARQAKQRNLAKRRQERKS